MIANMARSEFTSRCARGYDPVTHVDFGRLDNFNGFFKQVIEYAQQRMKREDCVDCPEQDCQIRLLAQASIHLINNLYFPPKQPAQPV
jgi:hypothetical protein